MKLLATLVLSALVLSSCAVVGSLRSPTEDYRSYIEDHVEQTREFDRGKQLIAVKALAVTPELVALKNGAWGDVAYAHDPAVHRVILALNNSDNGRLRVNEIEITLNGQPSRKVHEINRDIELQGPFYFAYPHYRVFVVDFDASGASTQELVIRKGFPEQRLTLNFANGGN